jgi:Leucine-rich repeat (LRR) protein
LNSLTELYLNNNKLKKVKKSWFNNKAELKYLHLDNNEVDDIDGDVFDGLNSLKNLHLNNNNLKKVKRSWFNQLYNLEKLSLGSNYCDELELAKESSQCFQRLKYFDFHGNKLSSFPASFLNVSRIEKARFFDRRVVYNVGKLGQHFNNKDVLELNKFSMETNNFQANFYNNSLSKISYKNCFRNFNNGLK